MTDAAKKNLPDKLREQIKKESGLYNPYMQLPEPAEDPHSVERRMMADIMGGVMREPVAPAAPGPGDLVAQMAGRLRQLEASVSALRSEAAAFGPARDPRRAS